MDEVEELKLRAEMELEREWLQRDARWLLHDQERIITMQPLYLEAPHEIYSVFYALIPLIILFTPFLAALILTVFPWLEGALPFVLLASFTILAVLAGVILGVVSHATSTHIREWRGKIEESKPPTSNKTKSGRPR